MLKLPRFRWFMIVLLVSTFSVFHGYSDDRVAKLVPSNASPRLALNPQDGEAVVFLGDSITHQSLYTQYLEDFFYTRYPHRRIKFHNAGVSGDKGSDALVRFDEDVAAHRPAYVTMLLGMNDGKYEDFTHETFAEYEKSISELLDRIEALGAKAIVLSPTMFDHQQARWRQEDETWRFRTKPISPRYNALLAYFGGWLLDQAGQRDLPFVNLWGPLNEHTLAGRQSEAKFTLIGDAIHPQAAGQMVMAFEILSQLGVEERFVSTLAIARHDGRWNSRTAQEIQFDAATSTLSFTHRAAALPWVVPAEQSDRPLKWDLPSDARLGYQLTRAGHKLSGERVKITGLPAGVYEVSIDDQVIGRWSDVALSTKIELQENDQTPQYQQALQVARLNQQRNDEAIRPMRDKWSTIKGLRNRYANDPAKLESNLTLARAAIAEYQQLADHYEDQIYQAAQPVQRRWTVRRVSDVATPRR